MRITVKDKKIETIEVGIDTPYELRALYILLKLFSQPTFKVIIATVNSFSDIPGLGRYCNDHIHQTPIHLIYNMLASRDGNRYTNSQKIKIYLACLKAINLYNNRLHAFVESSFFSDRTQTRNALTLFSDTANLRRDLTRAEFEDSQLVKNSRLNQDDIQTLYLSFVSFKDIINASEPVNPHTQPNLMGSHELFKDLSNKIQHDTNVAIPPTHLELPASLNSTILDKVMPPAVFASIIAAFIGVMLTVLKTYYDSTYRDRFEGDSKLLHNIVDNCFAGFTALMLLAINNRTNRYKRRQNDARMDAAVIQLADAIPAYKDLLVQTGARYQQSQITHLSTNEAEQGLLSRVNQINPVNLLRYGRSSI